MDLPKGRLKSIRTSVDGLSIHAGVSADPAPAGAPPVVLVHGLVISSRYMVPTAELLAIDYPVYAPDLPGYGESDKPDHLLNLPELADALCRWMDAMGLERATLLGNSMGCQKIVEFAVRHPDRIDRAILQGPTVDRHARNLPAQLGRFLLDSPHERPSQTLLMAYDYALAGIPRLLHTINLALADPIEQKLPQVQVPTLVVRGSLDPIVPQDWVEEVVRLLPQGQLAVIPGAGHTINYSAPLELARVSRAFIQATTNAVQVTTALATTGSTALAQPLSTI
jgi:2-hydroxy-6-oxonona-2,4-dienedioate hydrolase